ncbi:MAG: chemotaxis protein CheD [Spirochaetia bacterium]|nr:chemotaxis protein CheD [Spirochaetia bacterium]
MELIRVNMGELKTGGPYDILAAYGVGSCIIVVCYDRVRPVAAMLHGILPEKPLSGSALKHVNDNKYLNSGIENMVKLMIKHGVSLPDMEAKIFGGANMFENGGQAMGSIGERNIRMARETLKRKGVSVAGEDVGLNYGRSIEFTVDLKQASVKSFSAGTKII